MRFLSPVLPEETCCQPYNFPVKRAELDLSAKSWNEGRLKSWRIREGHGWCTILLNCVRVFSYSAAKCERQQLSPWTLSRRREYGRLRNTRTFSLTCPAKGALPLRKHLSADARSCIDAPRPPERPCRARFLPVRAAECGTRVMTPRPDSAH